MEKYSFLLYLNITFILEKGIIIYGVSNILVTKQQFSTKYKQIWNKSHMNQVFYVRSDNSPCTRER